MRRAGCHTGGIRRLSMEKETPMKHRFLPGFLSLALTLSLCVPPASALETEEARTLLETYYVDEIPEDILNLDSVEAILTALDDPYTVYMTAQEYQNFKNQVNGKTVVGIGVSVSNAIDDGMEILSVLDDSPALEAGLSAGDRILAVDGVTLEPGMDATALIQGEPDTCVTLTVRLHDGGRVQDFSLVRRAVTLPIATYKLVDGDVGYIDCESFGTSAPDVFREALTELEDQASLWIVDLRSNPGGTDTSAAKSLGWFANGTMVYMWDRDGLAYSLNVSPAAPDLTDVPAVATLPGEALQALQAQADAFVARQMDIEARRGEVLAKRAELQGHCQRIAANLKRLQDAAKARAASKPNPEMPIPAAEGAVPAAAEGTAPAEGTAETGAAEGAAEGTVPVPGAEGESGAGDARLADLKTRLEAIQKDIEDDSIMFGPPENVQNLMTLLENCNQELLRFGSSVPTVALDATPVIPPSK